MSYNYIDSNNILYKFLGSSMSTQTYLIKSLINYNAFSPNDTTFKYIGYEYIKFTFGGAILSKISNFGLMINSAQPYTVYSFGTSCFSNCAGCLGEPFKCTQCYTGYKISSDLNCC